MEQLCQVCAEDLLVQGECWSAVNPQCALFLQVQVDASVQFDRVVDALTEEIPRSPLIQGKPPRHHELQRVPGCGDRSVRHA